MGVIRFRGGLLAQFHDSFTIKNARTGFEVHGSDGSLIGEDVMTQEPQGRLFLQRQDKREEIDLGPHENLYSHQVRHFNAAAQASPPPSQVTIAGSLQSELGCADDWQPPCAATSLAFDADDGVWQRSFNVPAGSWEYKAALNGSWDENYGANATPNGGNIPLNLPAAAAGALVPRSMMRDSPPVWRSR